jgi:hypothetical protein
MTALLSDAEIKELTSYEEALQKIRTTEVIPLMELTLSKLVRGSFSDQNGAEIIREHNQLKDQSAGSLGAIWSRRERYENYLVALVKSLQRYLKFMGVEYPAPPDSIAKYLLG